MKIVFEVDSKLQPSFMVKFGYPHNDLVICKDSKSVIHYRYRYRLLTGQVIYCKVNDLPLNNLFNE